MRCELTRVTQLSAGVQMRLNPSPPAVLLLPRVRGPPEHLFPGGFSLITEPVFTGEGTIKKRAIILKVTN